MKVVTIEEIKTAKGIIPTGKIIDVPESALEKLSGKVKVIDHMQLIKEMVADMNRHHWPESLADLPTFSEIDKAYLAGDMAALTFAITIFKQAAIALLNNGVRA